MTSNPASTEAFQPKPDQAAITKSDDLYGWAGTDPNDPNFAHLDVYKKFEKLQELPEGWTRNLDPTGDCKAPYIHVSGMESFRHPNRPLMDKLIKELQDAEKASLDKMKEETETRTAAAVPPHVRGNIKKLRMMLQSGIPPAAVEQKAKLLGVDMAMVLGEAKEQDSSSEGPTSIPAPLLKKYKRMIKSGVPLKGVQAQAFLDGSWTPEQVVDALKDVLESSSATSQVDEQYAPRTKASHSRRISPTSSHKSSLPFTVQGDTLVFGLDTPLGALIHKTAGTVNQIRRANGTISFDAVTLYNALGALKGVQMARDNYNSICDLGGLGIPPMEIKAKRQSFAEIARTIGMDLPKDLKTTVNIVGLDELVLHIEGLFAKELAEIKDLVKEGWFDFDSLALLYTPGTRVVAKNAGGGGVDMICQVAWNRYEQGRTIMGQITKYFKVCFHYVVAVGSSHATIAEVVEGMESFEGHRRIKTALTFVPMVAYTQDEQAYLLARYRRRGEIFNQVALCGMHSFMSYDKGSFFLKRGGSSFESNGNSAGALATGGRIIVDTQGAYDQGHSLGIGYDPMVLGIKYKYKEYNLHTRSAKMVGDGSGAGASDASSDGLILFEKVPDDYLDMVWPCVVGFSLTAKGWGDVLVDGLEGIQWQDDIFDRLVLPENRKMMVKALVRHTTNSFQDLVQGKGEGTVFLMYGPPGVGKTLTAEAVAELLHKPLYSLSLGTLGTTPAELEQRLGQIMNMAAKWDALILLDEADSFLETRSSKSSLERNAMVSVMLKLVEYFSGILFLTSNRIDSLDPAFQTRITLALRYEMLNKEARAKVWSNLMIKSGFEEELKNGAIDPKELAKAILNGREIKNALRLAMAIAAEKGEPVSQAILVETVDIVNDYKATMANTDPYADEDKESNVGWCFPWWR